MLYFDVNGLGRRLLLYPGTELRLHTARCLSGLEKATAFMPFRVRGPTVFGESQRHLWLLPSYVYCKDQAYVRIHSETTIHVRDSNDAVRWLLVHSNPCQGISTERSSSLLLALVRLRTCRQFARLSGNFPLYRPVKLHPLHVVFGEKRRYTHPVHAPECRLEVWRSKRRSKRAVKVWVWIFSLYWKETHVIVSHL